jgi:polyisoprenoid-binding protein YceI
MANKIRYTFDAKASQFTVHAFASGLVAVVAHNPQFAMRDFSGEAQFVAGDLADASVNVRINASSLSLIDEVNERDRREINRVTFDEVLEIKRYPEIIFQSSQISVNKVSENLYQTTVGGKLLLHGISNNVSFPAQVVVGDDTLRAYGQFDVRQTEFGIVTASVAGGTLKMKDEVRIGFFIVARKQG